jgi:hypothetical protein
MLTLLLVVMSPLAVIGIIATVRAIRNFWKSEVIVRDIPNPFPYDRNNPFVKRMQRLANINQSRRYGDYRDRFSLANMSEDVWIPVREK